MSLHGSLSSMMLTIHTRNPLKIASNCSALSIKSYRVSSSNSSRRVFFCGFKVAVVCMGGGERSRGRSRGRSRDDDAGGCVDNGRLCLWF